MREPDKEGVFAKAWLSRLRGTKPAHEAHLASWVINGDSFHPLWRWWVMTLIHLRDIPGVKPARRRYPEAGYELLIVTINPHDTPPDPDLTASVHYLYPPELVYHFDGVTDEQALEILGHGVTAVLSGHLHPDVDWRPLWESALNDTIDHYRRGLH